ncbi:hypothetical protein L916_04222 [Phytophthora nicotianae]|uniref:Uncharacterized protein n=1 Tax=Phytophthora nicotianae TaxID=4792 RepID=W2JH93_PHYNI|nr:hypothetical protein L916_04222 [Phytophthora nicotianae]
MARVRICQINPRRLWLLFTIRSEEKVKEERLRRLNEEMDKNSSLKDMKRAFVIVGPDFGVCEMFDLKGAPDANTFLTIARNTWSLKQIEMLISDLFDFVLMFLDFTSDFQVLVM